MNVIVSCIKNIFNRINLKEYISINLISAIGYLDLLFILYMIITFLIDDEDMSFAFASVAIFFFYIIIVGVITLLLIILFFIEKYKKDKLFNNVAFCLGLLVFILFTIFIVIYFRLAYSVQ